MNAQPPQDYREAYTAFYQGTDPWREAGARAKAQHVCDTCGPYGPFQEVVEIGCGEGALLAELHRHAFARRYTGYDISASGVAAAAERELADTRIRRFDGERVPEKDGAFDLAILSHVVEHLEHPRALIREAARVAKWVFVEVPLEHHARTPHDFRWDAVGHVNLYDPVTLRHLVQSCGLTVVDQHLGHPQRLQYRMQYGWRGVAAHTVKGALLKLCPRVATRWFTYNGWLLARLPASTE